MPPVFLPDIYVSKIAAPTPMGTAIKMDRAVATMEERIKGRMPNCPASGFQI